MPHTTTTDALPIERVWLIECSRCANDATSCERTKAEAIAYLLNEGWSVENDRTYCPMCNYSLGR